MNPKLTSVYRNLRYRTLFMGEHDLRNLFQNDEKGVWYDPSDFATLFQDSSGTTPVTSVGQPVGKILDKSGNGNHATSSVSGERPLLQQDSDGKYYLSFDGINDKLSISISGLTYPLSRISAISQTSWTGFSQIFGDTITAFGAVLVQWGSSPNLTMHSGSPFTISQTLALGVKGVVYEKFDGAASKVQINNNSIETGNPGTTAPSGLVLGNNGGVLWPANCRIYGVVEISRALTNEEVLTIQRYMAGKSGVTL